MVESRSKSESEKQEDKRVDQEVSVGECSKDKLKEDQPSSSTTIPIPPAFHLLKNSSQISLIKILKFIRIFK